MTASPQPFRILHVCTGNICRSPMAERLTVHALRQRLGDGAEAFTVASAGTWGHEGSPMEAFAEQALAEVGLLADGFRARELLTEHVAEADLVLGATREHRAHVVTLVPTALPRTFTLREFARTAATIRQGDLQLPYDPVERARAVVRATSARRGTVPPPHPGADDLADPYGAPLATFRACARELAEAVDAVVDALVVPATARG